MDAKLSLAGEKNQDVTVIAPLLTERVGLKN